MAAHHFQGETDSEVPEVKCLVNAAMGDASLQVVGGKYIPRTHMVAAFRP